MTATDGPGPAPEPVHVDLPQDQRAPGQARRAAREALVSWRLPCLVDAVVLAVSELVTNAVRHGRPPVAMELSRRRDQVRLEVHDGDPGQPGSLQAEVDADAESGRGLGIVRLLAEDVAVEPDRDGGKVVNVDFRVPSPERGEDLAEPQPGAEQDGGAEQGGAAGQDGGGEQDRG